MTTQVWIGTIFAALLVAFLFAAYFGAGRVDRARWAILRFLCALCAGASGGFLTGEAVFRMQTDADGRTLLVAGTAGVALFFVVWYGFGKFVEHPPDEVSLSIPAGWSFRQAADALARSDQAVVELVGFQPSEAECALTARVLRTATVTDALGALRSLAPAGAIRAYRVSYSKPTYSLTVAEPPEAG